MRPCLFLKLHVSPISLNLFFYKGNKAFINTNGKQLCPDRWDKASMLMMQR